MRILYTLNSGQPGGMEYHTLDLVKGMVTRGHEVFVWCNQGPLADWFRNAGAQVFVNEVKVTFGLDIDPTYIYPLYKFLTKHEIEVLHCHELRAVANSLIAGTLAGVPVKISHIHTPFSFWPVSKLKRFLYSRCYAYAVSLFSTREIAITHTTKNIKIREGISAKKIIVIPNAVNDQKFDYTKYDKLIDKQLMAKKYKFPEDKFIFGSMSRLSQNKNLNVLIAAFNRLLKENKDLKAKTHLLIAGKGELKVELRALVASLNLQENITITGTFPDEDHIKLYNSIDALVFTSQSEGFGLVLIEALALQIPVISSDIDVLKEVGGNSVYAYFDTNDSQNIKLKMASIYENFESAKKLAVAASDEIRAKYSSENFVTNYEKLYQSLLSEGNKSV